MRVLPGAEQGKSRPPRNQHQFEQRIPAFYWTPQVGYRLSGQKLLSDVTVFSRGFAAFPGALLRFACVGEYFWPAQRASRLQCSTLSPEHRDRDNDSGDYHNHKHLFYTDEYGRHHNSVSRFGPPGYARPVLSKRLSLDGIFIVIFSRTQANTLRFPSAINVPKVGGNLAVQFRNSQ